MLKVNLNLRDLDLKADQNAVCACVRACGVVGVGGISQFLFLPFLDLVQFLFGLLLEIFFFFLFSLSLILLLDLELLVLS